MPDSDHSLLTRIWRSLTFKDVREADGLDDFSDVQHVKVSLLSFQDQRWYHQLLIFAVGIAIWVGTYAGIMHGMGWVEYATLDTTEAMQYRRYATTGAFVVAASYYSLLWTQAYGGVLTNLFWFPTLTVALMPRRVLGLFAGTPDRRYSQGGVVEAPVQWSVDVIVMLVPGYLPCVAFLLAMMIYWNAAGERGHRHNVEWHRQLPGVMLRDGHRQDWEELSPELQQVYLEAGYEPDTETEESESPSEDSTIDSNPPENADG